MTSGIPVAGAAARLGRLLAGRYQLFFAGEVCGEERWTIDAVDEGLVVTGEQETVPPHPFPSRHAYRATLSRDWRLTGLEAHWTVGPRMIRALHSIDGPLWRVRIEYGGGVREQQGDFPAVAEADYITHLFSTFILARRDFAVGGEHEFPVLRIGPPLMAVTPDRMLWRCVERGRISTPMGVVEASRYIVSLPPRGESEGYTFWAGENGIVLESYEGLDLSRPWMRLVELEER